MATEPPGPGRRPATSQAVRRGRPAAAAGTCGLLCTSLHVAGLAAERVAEIRGLRAMRAAGSVNVSPHIRGPGAAPPPVAPPIPVPVTAGWRCSARRTRPPPSAGPHAPAEPLLEAGDPRTATIIPPAAQPQWRWIPPAPPAALPW
jgi:hypothetical protein